MACRGPGPASPCRSRRPRAWSSSGLAAHGSPCTRGPRAPGSGSCCPGNGPAAHRRAPPGGPARAAAGGARGRGAAARHLRRARRSRAMIAAAQARQSLEQLGLAEAAAVLDGRLEAASQKQLPYADFLADLLSTETAVRRERYLRARTRLAHLPFQRTLDQFDFRFQPSIDKRQVRDLATLTFISEAANVLFLGPPGVGKTHLAIALGLRAIAQGSSVYFVRAHELLEDLRRAQAEHRLDRRMRVHLAPKLLIIDEFG